MIGVFSLPYFRQNHYELFSKVHTLCYLFVFVNAGMHEPKANLWILVFFCASFFLSRILRALKMCWNSVGNYATLTPMNGLTKVTFSERIDAKPGSHVFVTFPTLRPFESHPFTISDIEDTQLRVSRRGGFTAVLHDYATKNPGCQVRVLVEGPFGHVPNFKSFDRVLLIAGGVGATYSMSIALDIARIQDWPRDRKIVEFIWVVQHEGLCVPFE